MSTPVNDQTACDDATCCLGCSHAGEHHDADECWVAGDNVTGDKQCPCWWYEPANASHRHIEGRGSAA